MRSARNLLLGACAAAALVVSACGTPPAPDNGRYVNAQTGVDSGNCSKKANPCLTITYAVSQAVAGERVHVGPGTYPEMVIVDKPLVFEGNNKGRKIGTTTTPRVAESTVKGFRTPGEPHPSSAGEFNVTVDGFTIDPQGDAALMSAPTHHLVGLFGGTSVSVRNNIFNGGPWTSNCGYDCTDMTDAAVMVMSGTYVISDNAFANFRTMIDVTQFDAANPVVSATVRDNAITHVTNRAIWVNEYQGGPFPNTVTIQNNTLDAAGWDSTTWSPAGLVVTSGGNTIQGNTVSNFGSGVFNQVCDGTNVASVPNTFTANTFTGNRSGIQFFVAAPCGAATVTPTITNNNFDGGTWSGVGLVDVPKIGVRWNEVGGPRPNDITAECNFWGGAAGPNTPGASTTTAGVDFDPWNVAAGGACTGTV